MPRLRSGSSIGLDKLHSPVSDSFRIRLRSKHPSTRRSEVHLKIDVKDVAVSSDRIGHRRVSHGTIVQMDPLGVQTQTPLFEEVPVFTSTEFRRITVLAEDLRSA